jgi:hypothetical protein
LGKELAESLHLRYLTVHDEYTAVCVRIEGTEMEFVPGDAIDGVKQLDKELLKSGFCLAITIET